MTKLTLGGRTFQVDKEGELFVLIEEKFSGVLYEVEGKYDTQDELKDRMRELEHDTGELFQLA
jgi:hypothetical protein